MRTRGAIAVAFLGFLLAGPAPVSAQCITDAQCTDNNACNGVERCLSGVCQLGMPLNCNDGNVCTSDSCSPSKGCIHPNNTSLCNDQNNCTVGDVCNAGVCGGSTRNCNDNNVCTSDSCVPATGCVYDINANSCTDGNVCNGQEVCSGGNCQPGVPLTCGDSNPCTDDSCDPAAGCVYIDDDANSCADADACNGVETCVADSCLPGPTLECDDGNLCTDDSCEPATGCVHVNNDANSCDDGDVCNGMETCASGVCQAGSPLHCDDSNPCTDDSCDSAAGCGNFNDDSNSCSDGEVCNGAERCAAGSCQPGPPLTCDDSNPCTDDSCNPASGCVYSNDNTNSCSDGSVCNGVERCIAGICQAGLVPVCNDGNPCTDDGCDPVLGCSSTPDDANSCIDNNVCNGAESCLGGTCRSGTPLTCNDSNICTDDSCDPGSGCVYINDDAACDDGDACNGAESCVAGACQEGVPPTCDDSNACTDDSCHPATGCVFAADDGNSCDDANVCNGSERCANGSCQPGAPLLCDDGNACTDDSCEPISGCVFTNDDKNSCSDGNPCTSNDLCSAGVCIGGPPPTCDDLNPCTDDSCDPTEGCVVTNNSTGCDDGLFCTVADRCLDGTCVGGPDPCEGLADCDETSDSCGGCFPPMVTSTGSQFLTVVPLNPDAHPIALRVHGDRHEAGVACINLYVQSRCEGGPDHGQVCGDDSDCETQCVGGTESPPSCSEDSHCGPGGQCQGRCQKGRLGPDPVYLSAAEWGVTFVADEEVVPNSLFWVSMVCDLGAGAFESEAAGAITWPNDDGDGNNDAPCP